MIKLIHFIKESSASEEAHQRGLSYAGWSTWTDSNGTPVAKTVDGKLVSINQETDQTQHKQPAIAEKIAKLAHEGVFDKGGRPYIEHPINVAKRLEGQSPTIIAAALLHDTVEDNPKITPEYLKQSGVSDEVIKLVSVLTHDKKETYGQYISKIIAYGKDAMLIKLADLAENTREDRRKGISMDDWLRRKKKYLPAIERIYKALEYKNELSSSDVLDKKVGSAAGTNPGGFYVGKDGVTRYAKHYKNIDQAKCEDVSDKIYRLLNIDAPESTVVEDKFFASRIIRGESVKNKPISKEVAGKFLEGFVADVLLSNWDSVGLETDNIIVEPHGNVSRIDNGGSLLYRAQGQPKTREALGSISELEGFMNPKINPTYANMFKIVGVNSLNEIHPELQKQMMNINALLKKSNGDWIPIIQQLSPNWDKAEMVGKVLNYRTKLLNKKLGTNNG